MKTLRRLALLAAVLSSAGCGAPVMVGADFDPAVSMGHPATFAWGAQDELPTGDPRLDGNPFFAQAMRGAIERELAARGIRYQAVNPDLLVHYHASVSNRVDVVEMDRAAGYVESDYGRGTSVVQYDQGTWLIDVAEATSRRLLWRGWSRSDVSRALSDRKCMTELIDDSVRKMFGLFPVAVVRPGPGEPPPAPPAETAPTPMCPLPTDT